MACDGVGKGHQHTPVNGAVLLGVLVADHHDALGLFPGEAHDVDAVVHGPGVQAPDLTQLGVLPYVQPTFLNAGSH